VNLCEELYGWIPRVNISRGTLVCLAFPVISVSHCNFKERPGLFLEFLSAMEKLVFVHGHRFG
jgi:hypothetical protein